MEQGLPDCALVVHAIERPEPRRGQSEKHNQNDHRRMPVAAPAASLQQNLSHWLYRPTDPAPDMPAAAGRVPAPFSGAARRLWRKPVTHGASLVQPEARSGTDMSRDVCYAKEANLG